MAQEPQTNDDHAANQAAPDEPLATGHDENPQGVATRIEELPAADGADVMQNLSTEMSAEVAEYLDPQTAAKILSEMEPSAAAVVISDMEAPEASMVLAAMDPDDRVDILEHISAGCMMNSSAS